MGKTQSGVERLSRRTVLSVLATAPMVALPVGAHGPLEAALDPDERFGQALSDFKQAVRDRWPDQTFTFPTTWDESGDASRFFSLMAVPVYSVTR